MKHSCTLIGCWLAAISAIALPTSKLHKSELPSPSYKSATTIAGILGASAKSNTPHCSTPPLKAKTQPAKSAKAESKWASLGECTYVEDLATSFFYAASNVSYKVEVYEDQANPGIYRIVNPWKNYPYLDACIDEGASFDLTENSYITIDASNPDQVVIPMSPLGMSDSDGYTYVCSVDGVYDQLELSLEESLEFAGKLQDNVITFPIEKSLCLVQDCNIFSGSGNGKFTLVLPGGEEPIDYSLSISVEEAFCPDADGNYHITVSGDSRIGNVYYAAFGDYETLNETDADELYSIGTPVDINKPFPLDLSHHSSNVIWVLMIPTNPQGEMQAKDAVFTSLYNPAAVSTIWEEIGKAEMTEGFISGLFEDFEPTTMQVTIEQNTINPGRIRIVNPYEHWQAGKGYQTDHSHNHYMYINMSDPDYVYIEDSPIGLNLPGYGDVAVNSQAYYMIEEYGDFILQHLPMFGIEGGTLIDNVVTFPYSAFLMIQFSEYNAGKWHYTNFHINPNYGQSTNTENSEPMYLDGDFKLDLSKIYDSINDIEVNSNIGEAVYYNLQGIRVDNPSGGIFIRTCGKSTTKVYLK